MEAVAGLFLLLSLASLVAVFKPFGPYKKRWQAFVGFLVLATIGSALMPPQPADETSVQAARSNDEASPPEAAPSAPATPSTRWVYSRQRDEMRNANTDLACISSTNELEFSFPYQGGSTARICFRQSPQYGFDAWVSIERGQFTCIMDCTVRVKFGDGEIQTFSAGGASDGSADIIFISNASRFLTGARGASRIVIEAEFFQAGAHQMVFENTSGLEWPRPE